MYVVIVLSLKFEYESIKYSDLLFFFFSECLSKGNEVFVVCLGEEDKKVFFD